MTVELTEAQIARIEAADKVTVDTTSILYDGGGTAKALLDDQSTSAIPVAAEIIDLDGCNTLDIQLFDETAETFTVVVTEYSGSTPSLSNVVRQTVFTSGSKQDKPCDRAIITGLTTAALYAFQPAPVDVTPGNHATICIFTNITGPAYAIYRKRTR